MRKSMKMLVIGLQASIFLFEVTPVHAAPISHVFTSFLQKLTVKKIGMKKEGVQYVPVESIPTILALKNDEELTRSRYLNERSHDFNEFFYRLQGYMLYDRKNAVASLVRYPFATYKNGKKITTYETPIDFLKEYDKIITPSVRKAIRSQNIQNIFKDKRGICIGSGEIWIESVPSPNGDTYWVTAINGNINF